MGLDGAYLQQNNAVPAWVVCSRINMSSLSRVGTVSVLLSCAIFLPIHISAKTITEWKSRVIYQLLTDRFSQSNSDPGEPCSNLSSWCNGTWNGIIRHLDYIQNLGVDAIWISPIVENTDGGYHGYWAKNILRLNDHFGSEADLVNLISECHRRDIWVMADVVPNHMGYPPKCSYLSCAEESKNDFRQLVPFNETSHYHEYCEITWPTDNQTEIELCRLAYLPDLNQTVPFVRSTLYSWIGNLTEKYGFDGYRVDTVRHIEIGFWPGYQTAAGAYCIGEVWNVDSVDYLVNYQQNGLDAVLNFHLWNSLSEVFQNGISLRLLKSSIEEERSKFPDVRALGTFVDNHDMARFLNKTTDHVLFKNALTYIFYGEGIPVIYYGSEQGFHGGGDPDCRESLWPNYDQSQDLYQFIKTNLDFRRAHVSTVVSTQQQEMYVDDDTLIFSKGDDAQIIVVITNIGAGRSQSKRFHILQPDGTEYGSIYDSSDVLVVHNSQLTVSIVNGHPKVYLLRSTVKCASVQYCISAFLFATSLLTIVQQQNYRLRIPWAVRT